MVNRTILILALIAFAGLMLVGTRPMTFYGGPEYALDVPANGVIGQPVQIKMATAANYDVALSYVFENPVGLTRINAFVVLPGQTVTKTLIDVMPNAIVKYCTRIQRADDGRLLLLRCPPPDEIFPIEPTIIDQIIAPIVPVISEPIQQALQTAPAPATNCATGCPSGYLQKAYPDCACYIPITGGAASTTTSPPPSAPAPATTPAPSPVPANIILLIVAGVAAIIFIMMLAMMLK